MKLSCLTSLITTAAIACSSSEPTPRADMNGGSGAVTANGGAGMSNASGSGGGSPATKPPTADAAVSMHDAVSPHDASSDAASVDATVSDAPQIGDECDPTVVRGFDDSLSFGDTYCSAAPGAQSGSLTALCKTDGDCLGHARCLADVAGSSRGTCVRPCSSNDDCHIPGVGCFSLSGLRGFTHCFGPGGLDPGRSERAVGTTNDCVPECGGHLACCDATCFDLSTDQFNCGACGNACPLRAPFCEGGVCMPSRCLACAGGETCCSAGGPMGPQPTCLPLADGQHCPAACYDCMGN